MGNHSFSLLAYVVVNKRVRIGQTGAEVALTKELPEFLHQRCFRTAMMLVSLFVIVPSAARANSPKTDLDLSYTLGRTKAQLEEHFGDADIFILKTADMSTIQWKYIEGTWIFIILKDGRSTYVTYTFKEMDPFDQDEAFQALGIGAPKSLDWEWENDAKRWKPFGKYEKLVVNPKTQAVTVGRTHPYIDAGR